MAVTSRVGLGTLMVNTVAGGHQSSSSGCLGHNWTSTRCRDRCRVSCSVNRRSTLLLRQPRVGSVRDCVSTTSVSVDLGGQCRSRMCIRSGCPEGLAGCHLLLGRNPLRLNWLRRDRRGCLLCRGTDPKLNSSLEDKEQPQQQRKQKQKQQQDEEESEEEEGKDEVGEETEDACDQHKMPSGTNISQDSFTKRFAGIRTSTDFLESPERQGAAGDPPSDAVDICQSKCLSPVLSLAEAVDALLCAVRELPAQYSLFHKSGVVRLEVPFPSSIGALKWIRSLPDVHSLLPRTFFSQRTPREGSYSKWSMKDGGSKTGIDRTDIFDVAGVGSAMTFQSDQPFSLQHWAHIHRFLSDKAPHLRALGCIRFNQASEPSQEWSDFGTFFFTIPRVEFSEHVSGCRLSCTVIWEDGNGLSVEDSVGDAVRVLNIVGRNVNESFRGSPMRAWETIKSTHTPDEAAWHDTVQEMLQAIQEKQSSEDLTTSLSPLEALTQLVQSGFSNVDSMPLTKVVMARQTALTLEDAVDPFLLLELMKHKDPSAYQFCIQVPSGKAFMGSTPERLFVRENLACTSEAVAATRAVTGNDKEDLELALEFLFSQKDHNEFAIVRETVRSSMERVCKSVSVEEHKKVLKQEWVQHLYGRLNGTLHDKQGEFKLLMELHPTAAVCGHPKHVAFQSIQESEPFDRGMFAGPVGYFGGYRTEFAVGIRSALIVNGLVTTLDESNQSTYELQDISQAQETAEHDDHSVNSAKIASNASQEPQASVADGSTSKDKGNQAILYAGVGVVQGSDAASEWKELDLKISQFQALLAPVRPLEDSVNVNELWARMIIEECVRLGITYFCISPGSRSTPLAAAAISHPHVNSIICIDERSLAFHAIGYGRARNIPAVVIVTSGTAVANLYPAVVEASLDCVPLLLLTADRPIELHDTRANQTIDQVKFFGGYVRYQFNLPPPGERVPARVVLTTIDSGVNYSMRPCPGPVQINCQFRDPLDLRSEPWSVDACMSHLSHWKVSGKPFTTYTSGGAARHYLSPSHLAQVNPSEVKEVLDLLRGARRGLLIVGSLQNEKEQWSVASLARQLGWPTVADVLSGLRLQIPEAIAGDVGESGSSSRLHVIHHFNKIILCKDAYSLVSPDVILQIGGAQALSEKMITFVKDVAPPTYIYLKDDPRRHDANHLVTHRICMDIYSFVSAITSDLADYPPLHMQESKTYRDMLTFLSDAVETVIGRKIESTTYITEPWVARNAAQSALSIGGLFLGNSMPIRDVDMYGEGKIGNVGEGSHQREMAIEGLSRASRVKMDETPQTWKPGTSTSVAANRGASGIDGVLSTSVGFAVGLQRPVTLVVGDLSFIHDTNGLMLLKNRPQQPPVITIVINNEGGAIFSLLPAKNSLPTHVFDKAMTAHHSVRIVDLCRAHRVNHSLVTSKEEFHQVLALAQHTLKHWVIEVLTDLDSNVEFRRELQEEATKAVKRGLQAVSLWQMGLTGLRDMSTSLSSSSTASEEFGAGVRIANAHYYSYRMPLRQPPTTVGGSAASKEATTHVREGFLIRIVLEGGAVGTGEVAPLEGLHKESLYQAEQQLRLVLHGLQGVPLNPSLCLANGSLAAWLSDNCSFQLYPSIQCGLEMAVLTALSSFCRVPISQLLSIDSKADSRHSERSCRDIKHVSSAHDQNQGQENDSGKEAKDHTQLMTHSIQICGLLEGTGTPEETARAAVRLVNDGFSTIKLKVARRSSPSDDVAVVKAVRKAVGREVQLRADANRKWSLEDSLQFGKGAFECELQYVEEPVSSFASIETFHRATGIPVALDESVDEDLCFNTGESGEGTFPEGVVAVVLKPGVIGGLERTLQIARWAAKQGVHPVISSAFESSIALSMYAEMAYAINSQGMLSSDKNEEEDLTGSSRMAHGLGTFPWIQEDVIVDGRWILPDGDNSGNLSHTPICPVIRQKSKALGGSDCDRNVQAGGRSSPSSSSSFLSSSSPLLLSPSSSCPLSSSSSLPSTSPSSPVSSEGQLSVNITDTSKLLKCPRFNTAAVSFVGSAQGDETMVLVDISTSEAKYTFRCLEMKSQSVHKDEPKEKTASHPTLVFLHGFLGQASDWAPIMCALSLSFRCIAVDLPGHGGTSVQRQGPEQRAGRHSLSDSSPKTDPAFKINQADPLSSAREKKARHELNGESQQGNKWQSACGSSDETGEGSQPSGYKEEGSKRPLLREEEGEEHAGDWKMAALSVENVAEALSMLVRKLVDEPCIVVGYSMGARVALHMATYHSEVVHGAAIVSGSPGISSEHDRAQRLAQDRKKAKLLRDISTNAFIHAWYQQPLWKSFRNHPSFRSFARKRADEGHPDALADVLVAMSTGKQEPVWEELSKTSARLLFVAGAEDAKFVAIMRSMYRRSHERNRDGEENSSHNQVPNVQMVEVPGCGHVVHVEKPDVLVKALHNFALGKKIDVM